MDASVTGSPAHPVGAASGAGPFASLPALVPGIAAAVALAIISTAIGHAVPIIGSAVPAVVMGAVMATIRRPSARLAPGLDFAGKTVLQAAVVVLGLRLSLAQVVKVGVGSLPVMLGTLAACLLMARLAGRLLGIDRHLRILIGSGTGICGASAIAAVAPVIGAAGTDIAYAISTIFVFNIAAVIVFPVIGHALGMSQHAFGLFSGTAVNDTSSVIATATSYGPAAADYAVVVKLVRTLMIIPVVLLLALARRRSERTAEAVAFAARARSWALGALRLIPWFLVGFLLMAAVNSAGAVPESATGAVAATSAFLISVALAGIGLSTDLRALRRTGLRPLLLGAVLWASVSLTSLLLQAAASRW